jgi:integrase
MLLGLRFPLQNPMKRGSAKPESVHQMATKFRMRRPPKRTDPNAPIKARKLSDQHIEALREFDTLGTYPDSVVPGLRIRVGVHRSTWLFFQRRRIKGERSTTFRALGTWPLMDVEKARKEALIVAGKVAGGNIEPSKRDAIKFETAFAAYLEHLKAQAAKRGKPPRWHNNVKKLGETIILPKFGKWSLIELANSPDAVADWHVDVTKTNGPVSANHCARVVRAAYKRAGRRDISLPARLPTSAVEFNDETPSQKALDFKKFPAWLKAWRKIDSATRQAYHLTELLTGTRPGELARLRWADVKHNERNLVIGKAKAGHDITIPITEEIAAALQMARDDAAQLGLAVPDSLVFAGCSQISAREALPARGNMLRHTYRTVAADLGVDDLLIHFLMGHTPRGISRKYVAVLILANGPAMRAAQERISARTLKELGLTFKTLRQEIAAGLAQSLEGGQGRAVKNARALARAARASARARRGKPSRPHTAETKAKISVTMKKSKAAAPG